MSLSRDNSFGCQHPDNMYVAQKDLIRHALPHWCQAQGLRHAVGRTFGSQIAPGDCPLRSGFLLAHWDGPAASSAYCQALLPSECKHRLDLFVLKLLCWSCRGLPATGICHPQRHAECGCATCHAACITLLQRSQAHTAHLNQDEGQRQRGGRCVAGGIGGRQPRRRRLRVAHDQVAIRRLLLRQLLQGSTCTTRLTWNCCHSVDSNMRSKQESAQGRLRLQ